MTYIFLGLTDGLLVARGVDAGNILVRLKYYLMILTVACSLLHVIVYNRSNIFWKETKQLSIVVIVFALISGFEIITVGAYTSDVSDSLTKLALPVLLAYGVLNTLTYKQLQISMVVVLGFSIAGYVCELLFGGFPLRAFLRWIMAHHHRLRSQVFLLECPLFFAPFIVIIATIWFSRV